jgi:proteasome assembly chaperone (PAC2) family protein
VAVTWSDRPRLREPVLLAAFTGWNDAGDAASGALEWLGRRFGRVRLGTVDADDHVDYQVSRPTVELTDGRVRAVTWPDLELSRLSTERRDLVLLEGPEPNYGWRRLCAGLIEAVRALGCATVVTCGALLADVPHTRIPRLTGVTDDEALAARLGVTRSRYEGPTGITGVLADALRRAGLPSVSLWAPVPHYAPSAPAPAASRALLEAIAALTGVELDLSSLDGAIAEWRREVDEAIAGEAEVRAYVAELEAQADAEAAAALPSGDDLAAQVEDFLRRREED